MPRGRRGRGGGSPKRARREDDGSPLQKRRRHARDGGGAGGARHADAAVITPSAAAGTTVPTASATVTAKAPSASAATSAACTAVAVTAGRRPVGALLSLSNLSGTSLSSGTSGTSLSSDTCGVFGTVFLPRAGSGDGGRLTACDLARHVVERMRPQAFVPRLVGRSLPPFNSSAATTTTTTMPAKMPNIVKIHYGCGMATYLIPDRVVLEAMLGDDSNDGDGIRSDTDITIGSVHVTLRLGLYRDRCRHISTSGHLHALMPHCPVADVYDALAANNEEGTDVAAPVPEMLDVEIATEMPIGLEDDGDDEDDNVRAYEVQYVPSHAGDATDERRPTSV